MVHFVYRVFSLESSVDESIRINSTNCTKLHSHCGRLPCHVLPNMRAAGNVRSINFQWLRWIIFWESVRIDQQINNLRNAEKRQIKPIKSQLSHWYRAQCNRRSKTKWSRARVKYLKSEDHSLLPPINKSVEHRKAWGHKVTFRLLLRKSTPRN